ncbi:PREDICTED: REST corepressor isoform X3 [Papilio xuthus]|uniref:REST corepressor isoform X3 n=1 Tax=Papilio xuthus TaxID=66420 RepID=A0AAJ7E4H2_PAPXU|nr:PREDICTED: REST corepressor isoform X3 [Papilio xuthus]
MVLAERSSDVRNGKRSRGPSPNGHGSPDSSSEDENVVPFAAEKIRVGRDYQAVCPELEPVEQRKPEQISDRALLVWSPTSDISDIKLDEYITTAKEKYGYNGEQALGMLFWHKHDLSRASMDLANFTPFPDEWTVEDKVLFEQAFQFHGKSFHRIRQMLPDKSIASLVKYYYSWKKTRARTSLMDVVGEGRNATGSGTGKRESGAGSEQGVSDKDSDNDEKKWNNHRGIVRGGKSLTSGGSSLRIGQQGEVQQNKQQLSAMKRKVGDAGVEELRPGEPPAKINARWTNDELLMAVTAVRKYGKDFQAIAETLGTKTEAHVRTFFITYRRRYNLDAVLREHEADRGSANHIQQGTTSTEGGDNVADNTSGNGTASPQANAKDEKTEVDSEGVAIGASAEQGGPPTTPPKHKPAK